MCFSPFFLLATKGLVARLLLHKCVAASELEEAYSRKRPISSSVTTLSSPQCSGTMPILSRGRHRSFCSPVDQMVNKLVVSREASRLWGLSTDKRREWTTRRGLVPRDILPKTQRSPAKVTRQTVSLIRIASKSRSRFHLKLQAHRAAFNSLRQTDEQISFSILWGKVDAIHGGGRWTLTDDTAIGCRKAVVVDLDSHHHVLSAGFCVPHAAIPVGGAPNNATRVAG